MVHGRDWCGSPAGGDGYSRGVECCGAGLAWAANGTPSRRGRRACCVRRDGTNAAQTRACGTARLVVRRSDVGDYLPSFILSYALVDGAPAPEAIVDTAPRVCAPLRTHPQTR